MKKLLIFLMGILLLAQQGYSQKVTVVENFDNQGDIFVRTPFTAWKANNVYSKSSPYSCWGEVPKTFGDSITLVSPVYNLAVPVYYTFAYLRFSHICKLSPSDTARIEWRENMGGGIFSVWKPIPGSYYTGQAANYAQRGFCGTSYTEWQGADSTATPDNLWWKEETFDISNLVGISEVQFRFIIKRGRVSGSNIAYGWLIDNFEFVYSTYNVKPPVVEFIAPFIKDTVYGTGPWEINAKIKSSTSVGLHQPYLKWTTDGITYDSVVLVKTKGDSLWKETIPQYVVGTKVSYSITGRDSSGNTATANSSYFIVAPPPGQVGYVTVGTGTSAITTNPYYYNYNYSYSRNYYKSHEISPYRMGGLISEIAFYKTTANSSVDRITFYLKATTDTVNISTAYIDPLLDGAVKVWGEATATGGTGWISFPLSVPFYLPPNMHLLVYCDNKNGNYQSQGSASFQYTTQTTNTSIYVYDDNSFPPTMYTSISGNRPNIRLNFIGGGTSYNNSASSHSIDIKDTVPTSPIAQVPIVVTVKNKGTQNLNQVTVSYTINGGAVQSKIFNFSTALAPDFNGQDTVGYYTPKMDGYDTITVWVSMPNNVIDSSTWDDTLIKTVYGTTDLLASFVNTPADTVYHIGPYNVTAKINSLSGKTVLNTVSLYVESDISGTTYYDTLPMAWNGTTNLWGTTIAQKPFGSTIRYKIMEKDYLNNTITISNRFYVKLITASGTDTNGYVIVGTGTSTTYNNPFYYGTSYSWSRQIYLASEIRSSLNGGIITGMAWDYANGFPMIKPNQTCYFKAVDDTVCTANYLDPIADGATMVWQGNFISSAGRTWAEFPLSASFVLPPRKNLMVYWIDEAGAPTGNYPYWYYTATANNMAVYNYDNVSLPTYNGALTTYRPNARFYVERMGAIDSNSVSLRSIDSPPRGVTPGVAVPVTVTVRNEGLKPITSCNIYWKRNGVQQPATFAGSPTYTFNPPLQPGYSQTVNINSFTPTSGKKDTLVIWVSLPNGQLDPVKKDDTLSIITESCPLGVLGVLKKTYTVGSTSSDFTTIGNAISYLENCGFSGRVTLQLENKTFRESADFSRVRATANDTLEIVPLSGSPLIETTKFGIKLGGLNNVIVRNLRINITGEGYGIWITSGSNLEISGCTVNLDTTLAANQDQLGNSVANTHNAFYKDGGISNNVRVLNNTFTGGYNVVLAYGRDELSRDTGWVFDGNTIRKAFYMSAYLYYIDFQSISRNTCIAMTDMRYFTQTWVGFCVQDGIAKRMEENKVYQSVPIYIPRAFILTSMNNNATPMELRNNEVILAKTGNYVFTNGSPHDAFILQMSNINVYHNSAYISEDEISNYHLLYMAASSTGSVKNNNFVATHSRPISITDNSSNPIIMDYNNYYTDGTNIGTFRGNAAVDLATWKSLSGQDSNTLSVLPNFINTATNLKLADFQRKMSCTPPIPGIVRDIEQTPRDSFLVTRGCYVTLPMVNLNATLLEILGLRSGSVVGQTDTLKAVVLNTGRLPINSVRITWTLNGTTQTSQNYTTQVNAAPLSPGQSIDIPIGTITYPLKNAEVKFWIDYVNSGVVDGFQGDDTIKETVPLCPSGYSGVLTIGPSSSSNFKTIEDAYKAIDICGITGDITFAFESGTYNYGLTIANNASRFGNYKLTITSIANNANNVTFLPTSGAGITISNATNLVIKAITVDARTSGYYAVHFTGGCSNLTIRDCKILCDTISTSAVAVIYKSVTTSVDSVSFINNLLDGGYYGFYFYGGSGTSIGQYGTNIVFDSNTVSNQYLYATYPLYCYFKSMSNNKFLSRTVNNMSYWYGIRLYYCNAENVVGNRVLQRNNTTMTYSYGAYIYYANQCVVYTPQPMLFANNEFILYHQTNNYAIYDYNSGQQAPIHYLHNSIYVGGTGGYVGLQLSSVPTTNSGAVSRVIKNNLIHITASSGYPIYLGTAFNVNLYDIDYNNMYAPTYVGYAGGARQTISGANSWQTYVTSDRNSVKVMPTYINLANGLELSGASSNDSLRCPPLMVTDIKGTARPAIGTMGAYEKPLSGLDLMLVRIQPTMSGVIHNQMLKLSVDIVNFGATAITSAVLRWSINNITQPAAIPLTFNPSLKPYEQRNIFLDSFRVQGNYDIVVWIESVNGSTTADTVKWNDTVSHSYVAVPLAEFVAPFVADTINLLAFNVLVNIYEGTGAPVVRPPKMAIQTIYNGTTLYDTITMTRNGSNWVAAIPPQYFNSKVIYSLFVADTMGNNILLRDSTFIKYDLGSADFNLKMTSLVSPVRDPAAPCTLSQASLEVRVTNTGNYDYNFAKDNMVLTCEMIDAQHTYSVFTKTISIGTLLSGQSNVYQIDPNVQMNLGTTDIKVWLSCRPERNTTTTDDTLTDAYTLTKLGFPVQEDFENPALPPEFTSVNVNTSAKWEVIQGNDGKVSPYSGSGMLRFGGSKGAVSQVYVKQLDLSMAQQPTLSFWYFHDTVACNDFTVVKVTTDGNVNAGDELQTIYKQDTFCGWKLYEIGLAKYTNSSCVVIVFEAMSYTSKQYIDLFALSATQNLKLDTILIPSLALCDYSNKNIQVVISNPSAQHIDFSKDSTRINLQVNAQNFTYKLNSGILYAQTSQTITITTMTFVSGTTYNLTATVLDPIDAQPSDDITKLTLVLDADIAIKAHKNTYPGSCFRTNSKAEQLITIQNKSTTYNLYNIPISLRVENNSGGIEDQISETVDSLRAGQTRTIPFKTLYKVPMTEDYVVTVRADLVCDADQSTNVDYIYECVDFDIELVEILEPDNVYDEVGEPLYIVVKVVNSSPNENLTFHAQIIDGKDNKTVISSLTETGYIQSNTTEEYRFTKPYNAPAVKNYTIKVFINTMDNHTKNDTVTKESTTNVGIATHGATGFSLGQNIPNPVKENTLIAYNIPQDGEVIFTLYAITGQALYVEKRDAHSGNNEIAFNTANLANGIYYYAMEYKGERLVKKMTIRK